jgi:hypothetical protein
MAVSPSARHSAAPFPWHVDLQEIDDPELATLVTAESVIAATTRRSSIPCPTPAEIRWACLAIQATWSRRERRRRELGVIPDGRGWRTTFCQSVEFLTVPVATLVIGGAR